MLNGGGAVLAQGEAETEGRVDARLTVKGTGTLLVYCEAEPAAALLDGQPAAPTYHAGACLLRVQLLLPTGAAAELRLSF
mmetsp:Transcript_39428/g.79494  ORF Transcript_39428/g.79494 Transcript_39428/m.79494 type:complete len:80 (-) Transcript_39428:110-349(-)